MDSKAKLTALRNDIDRLDKELVGHFIERMRVSEQIAQVKAEGNISVVDQSREGQVIKNALAISDEENKSATVAFMRALMALSKIRQNQKLMLSDPAQFPNSAAKKTEDIQVAFQGVSGAWSQQGAEQLFPQSAMKQKEYFEDVFEAVGQGEVDYGVLPIENSQTGSIGEVYDLLKKHSCYIVGEVWISIAQCLLACEGTELSDIRELYSHPEGFNQCRRYLKNKNWDLTACRNTAYAAQLVKEKSSPKYAAIGSRRAAQAHDLKVLVPDIMDDANNKTRFIAIAANPIYDQNSGTTSVTFSTRHESGALCSVLQSFMLAGINLTRIESRPAPGNGYRFFADLQANILSEQILDALRQAAVQCSYFEILGCY